MASKTEKPQLAGARIKSRKRDEKVKFDPVAFSESLITRLNDCENLAEYLEEAGNSLDYRRYSDQFFDIFIAGGILAPGGTLEHPELATSEFCVFRAGASDEEVKQYSTMLDKVLRRFKYLQVLLEEHAVKVLKFLKAFTEEQRVALAKFMAQIMSSGMCSAKPLNSLFQDQLVKDGFSEEFMFSLFRGWLAVSSINSLATSFRKGSIVIDKLLLIYPLNKRSEDHLIERIREVGGLDDIVTWLNSQRTTAMKSELQATLTDAFADEKKPSEIVAIATDAMSKSSMKDHDVVTILWTALMDAVEWNKKSDLIVEQALRQVNKYCRLLAHFTQNSEKAQLLLINKTQNYCYDNQTIMKVFVKIIMLLYHHGVIEEEAIRAWYDGRNSSKGRTVFLEQTAPLIEWLDTADVE
ncbi:uncharacterized protein MONBRDRAFT_16574 [Monosiga brevicollis MX1]|uniref:W2 domain-containing protein n=1 Tax=Monosiga brevicollis TaxID=81824 RepID=A9UX88_MONBE|nr:uncharacterized protein MONBRDRAFT_16574 [Monosiga brevicollis MX1]EDQ90177.1 predicted protein [Monosiga brevicollis MX1]|eukprot:XP_001744944.1 hypothetical protein [Monosiga brevicollis MX1]